jgi:hypothetical protein
MRSLDPPLTLGPCGCQCRGLSHLPIPGLSAFTISSCTVVARHTDTFNKITSLCVRCTCPLFAATGRCTSMDDVRRRAHLLFKKETLRMGMSCTVHGARCPRSPRSEIKNSLTNSLDPHGPRVRYTVTKLPLGQIMLSRAKRRP